MPDAPEHAKHRRRLEKAEEIFDQVINIPANERAQLLAQLCDSDTELYDEITSLIKASNNAKGFLSVAPTAVEQVFADKLNPHTLLGKQFGPYRLLKVLERGGMGVVFLAERADGHYEEKVAIKFANYKVEVVGLMGRFSRERQILAKLRHPYVARLLDAGTSTDGYPYLVMEYISGQPIDHYCQFNSLSIQEILLLMQSVCDIVQHAHQNLIVHCDLKPDNILVAENGQATLLDFGIAQLLSPIRQRFDKRVGTIFSNPMTPAFAAPEQITGGAITTATDVHALGNILYRLMTGVQPQYLPSRTEIQISQTYQAQAPQVLAPSKVAPIYLRKSLLGDVDNIILRAMSHDPSTRYSSAQALSEDIGCYLSGKSVMATDGRLFYRTSKFIYRHKLGAAMASIVMLSILVGVTGTLVQWHDAKHARILAENHLNEIRTMANTIVFDLPQTIGALPGSTKLRERLLTQGVAYLDRLSSQQQGDDLMSELATAYHELARIQGGPMSINLGDRESAVRNFKKSVSIRENLLANDEQDHEIRIQLAESYVQMSGIYGGLLNMPVEAKNLTDKCLDLIKPLPNRVWPDVVSRTLGCLTLAAHWANVSGESDEAAVYLIKATHTLDELLENEQRLPTNEKHRYIGRVHEEWAQIFSVSGQPTMAVKHEQQRLSEWLKISPEQGSRSRLLGAAYHGLAARIASSGDYNQAQDAYQESLHYWHDWQQRYPDDIGASQSVAIVHAELADLLWKTKTVSTNRQLACRHYQSSIESLDVNPSGSWPFPKRYLWSPTLSVISRQKRTRCG